MHHEFNANMLIQSLTHILRGTPVWVYPLFFGLIVLGYLQSKPREVAPARLAILPLALGVLSLSRVLGTFGPDALALAAWAGFAAAGFGLGLLSGAFLARVLWVWGQRRAEPLLSRA